MLAAIGFNSQSYAEMHGINHIRVGARLKVPSDAR